MQYVYRMTCSNRRSKAPQPRSSPSPNKPFSSSKAAQHATTARSAPRSLIHRTFCYFALPFHAFHNAVKVCLDHYSTYNHLSKSSMQRFEIKYEVQFANILEETIK